MSFRPPELSLLVRGGVRVRPAEQRELCRRVERAMIAAAARGHVTLSLTSDREIRELNRAFANEDHATDVLSFSQVEGVGEAHGLLGDIIISVPTARRQAQAGGRPLVEELAHLAVHGLAHLCGYDHATERQERTMFAWEAKLRAQAVGRGVVQRVPRPRKPNGSRSRRA